MVCAGDTDALMYQASKEARRGYAARFAKEAAREERLRRAHAGETAEESRALVLKLFVFGAVVSGLTLGIERLFAG